MGVQWISVLHNVKGRSYINIKLINSLCAGFLLKERRKVYEANLEKVGLELEIEDKSVRMPNLEYYHKDIYINM